MLERNAPPSATALNPSPCGERRYCVKEIAEMWSQLKAFAAKQGLLFLKQLDLESFRIFRQRGKDSGISAVKKLERLRAFLSFAHESGWIDSNPGRKLKNPKVSHQPTLPFSQDEMISILAACERYPDNYGNFGGVTVARLWAFILLLRYSGMRIGDAASCALDRLRGDRLSSTPRRPVCR